MSGTHDSPAEHADRGSIESRDVLLVAAAIFALVVAAFVMPPTAAGGGGPGGDGTATATATPSGESGGGSPGDGTGELNDDVEVRPGDGGGGSSGAEIVNETDDPHPDCFVIVWDRLVPGKDVTVLVWNDGAVDAGRVPYSKRLAVTVRQPDAETCTFVNLNRTTGFDEWHGASVDFSNARDVKTVPRVDGNVSATFDVLGEPDLVVTGEPFPGETVRLHATVDDVPMRSATVTVNGQEVGETDEDGNYTLRVPDDGTETLAVEVSRGDFSAGETVTVLLLDVEVRSGLLAIPGREAVAVTTLGDRRARDVTVRLGGERVGTTDLEGRTVLDLPADPRTTVTVAGYGQTATAAIWPLYLRTLFVVLLGLAVVVGSLAGTSRRESAGTTRLVAGAWAALGVLAVAWVLGGRQGLALVLGAGGLLGLALATFVYRETAVRLVGQFATTCRALLRATAATLGAVVRGLMQLAIRLADLLLSVAEGTAARLRAGLAQLARASRSLPALLGLLRTWLVGLGRDLGRLVRRGRTHLTARRLGVVGPVAVVAGAGYAVGDLRGALVAAVVSVALFGYAWRRPNPTTAPDRRGGSPPATLEAVESGDGSTGRPTLRALWRTFARWVVPGRWTSHTPGEVARGAIELGFPREPVERLTAVFREVEYGDHSLSEERYARARAAFRALRGTRSGETEGKK